MFEYVLFAAFILIFLFVVIRSIKLKNEILNNGIQVDATVSRIEEYHDEDGTSYKTYVIYRNQEGNEVEALLATSKSTYTKGDKILIKYLNKKPNYVVPVEE